jgi:F-type H+-transporting ATPase subunit c
MVETAAAVKLIGAGLVVIGVGLGIGRIGGSAMDAIARQPEATNKIQTAMLIAAALIEGIGFAGIICSIRPITLSQCRNGWLRLRDFRVKKKIREKWISY